MTFRFQNQSCFNTIVNINIFSRILFNLYNLGLKCACARLQIFLTGTKINFLKERGTVEPKSESKVNQRIWCVSEFL
jgi:hypothetical protein